MTVRFRWAGAAVVAMAAMTAAACGNGSAAPADGKIKVVASTDVWGSVVRAVGGDDVAVTSIIDDPTKDPHDYEIKPTDTAAVAGAQLLVSNGIGYDDFFAKAVSTVGAGKPSVVAFDVSGKTKTDDTNEHVFYDLPTVKKVADKIAEDLGNIDAGRKATFDANAKAFDAKIDGLIAQLGKLPAGKKAVVTEPVANYLLAAGNVSDATPEAFEKAVEGGTDIPVAAVAAATALIQNHQVDALVNNAQTETDVTNQLKAKAAAANIPVVDVTETLPAGTTDYVGWIGKEVDALSKALVKQ
ncbi:metal ABC transporter solute-binding protein, Zn/Mn family [Kutzneria buriramensis]|uniref:Zinc/manganese transport system substrate-binding protein n=1 Tax=Kutzneria buriramensis TaxID=1045776 RepID=A0A3E0HVJ6_9PSEU|nr:zinc ABC transporter substrate-binding protein [Kutzneria buriramensis]REH50266.1 zinc/manganese transport system substrate-binding protein [Kutzneria buriramensis]